MKKRNAEEPLETMIELLLVCIEELFEYKDVEGQRFRYGERLAYAECLEWIRERKYAEISFLSLSG